MDLGVPIVFFKPDAFDWPRELEQWRGNDALSYASQQITSANSCALCKRTFLPGQPRSLSVEVQLLATEPGDPEVRRFASIVTHTACKSSELRVVRSEDAAPTEQQYLYTMLLGQNDDGTPDTPISVLAAQSPVHDIADNGDLVNVMVPSLVTAGFELFLTDDISTIAESAPRPPNASVTVEASVVTMHVEAQGKSFPWKLADIDLADEFKVGWREAVRTRGEVLVITGTATRISDHDASDYVLIPEGSGGQVLACYATLASGVG